MSYEPNNGQSNNTPNETGQTSGFEWIPPAADLTPPSYPTSPPYQPPNPQSARPDKHSIGFMVLSFFVPIVGLILFLIWKKDTPRKAKGIGIAAIIGVVLGVTGVILILRSAFTQMGQQRAAMPELAALSTVEYHDLMIDIPLDWTSEEGDGESDWIDYYFKGDLWAPGNVLSLKREVLDDSDESILGTMYSNLMYYTESSQTISDGPWTNEKGVKGYRFDMTGMSRDVMVRIKGVLIYHEASESAYVIGFEFPVEESIPIETVNAIFSSIRFKTEGEESQGRQEADTEEAILGESPDTETYPSGMYQIGIDMPPGEYVIIGSGYFELANDSTGKRDGYITSDLYSSRTVIATEIGQFLTFDGVAYPIKAAPPVDVSSGKLKEGTYLVGADFPAGEYKISPTGSLAYMQISRSNSRNQEDIITNSQFDEEKTITVKEGQYLKFYDSELILE